MKREEQIMNDPNLSAYTDKQRGWINEAFMDGVRWADENRPVDWQQVRIQAAISAMQGMLSNYCSVQSVMDMSEEVHRLPSDILAAMAVSQADALVKELKEE